MIKRLPVLCVLLLLAASCGGGGGGNSAPLIGSWLFNLSLLSDSCRAALGSTPSQSIMPTYLVNQDGSNIVASNIQTGATFTGGTVDDGRGFIAARTDSDTVSCDGTNVLEIASSMSFDLSAGSDNQAEVGLALVAECGRTTICRSVYQGTASKL